MTPQTQITCSRPIRLALIGRIHSAFKVFPNKLAIGSLLYCITFFVIGFSNLAHAGYLWDSKEEKAQQSSINDLSVETYINSTQRVQNVLYRLGVAANGNCGMDVKPLMGFGVASLEDFPSKYRDAAEKYQSPVTGIKFDQFPRVIYIADESQASSIGLSVGDRIISIGKDTFGRNSTQSDVFESFQKQVAKGSSAALTFEHEGAQHTVSINGVKGCYYDAEIVPMFLVNAWTNGYKISVTQGLLDTVESESELALVIGHEMAHAAFNHVRKIYINNLPAQALDLAVSLAARDPITQRGVRAAIASINKFAQANNRRNFEREADYIGLYFLRLANYEINGSEQLWMKKASEYPEFIEKSYWATHPANPERLLLVNDAITEIHDKEEKHQSIAPNLK